MRFPTQFGVDSAAHTANGNSEELDLVDASFAIFSVALSALAGTSPTIQFIVSLLGADGVYYPVAQTAVLSAASKARVVVGIGMEIDTPLSEKARLDWVITGTLPIITFSYSVQADKEG